MKRGVSLLLIMLIVAACSSQKPDVYVLDLGDVYIEQAITAKDELVTEIASTTTVDYEAAQIPDKEAAQAFVDLYLQEVIDLYETVEGMSIEYDIKDDHLIYTATVDFTTLEAGDYEVVRIDADVKQGEDLYLEDLIDALEAEGYERK